MSEADVFILSDEALERVIKQIPAALWDKPVPDSLAVNRKGATLRELINYHAYDEAWVPDTLAGKTAEEVGAKYDGDLLGDDPAAAYSALAVKAAAAARAVDLKQVSHLSYGDFPAGEYLVHITSFRGFRAYDIAKYIGADTKLDPALVQGMWDEFSPQIENWRAMGVFGPEVPVPEDADLQSRLLGMAGRDPR